MFRTFSPGCVDQGLRIQRLLILVCCGESSGSVAQLRGWRRISQPTATTPSLQVTEPSNNPKRHCSLLGTYHYTTHRAHCSSRSTAGRCRRLAERASQGHAMPAIAALPEPSLRFSPDLTSTASHIPRKAEHLGRLEQKKTAASLIPMTAVAAFDRSTQRGHKQILPGLGSPSPFPFPAPGPPQLPFMLCPARRSSYTLSHQLGESPTKQAPSFPLL